MPDLNEYEYAKAGLNKDFEKGVPNKDVNYDLLIERLKSRLMEQLENILRIKESVKVQLKGVFQFYKKNPTGRKKSEYEQSNKHRTTPIMQLTRANLEEVFNSLVEKLFNEMMSEKMNGSGWKVRRIPSVSIIVYETRPARGDPKSGVINIRNDDQECFKWMKYHHQSKQQKHDDRISVLKKVDDKFNYDGISCPTSFDDIPHFEEQNQVSTFVYGMK